jgi:hypothetical protein
MHHTFPSTRIYQSEVLAINNPFALNYSTSSVTPIYDTTVWVVYRRIDVRYLSTLTYYQPPVVQSMAMQEMGMLVLNTLDLMIILAPLEMLRLLNF